MDYVIVGLLAAMWLTSVIGAYSAGWISGNDAAEEKHRWSRWILNQYTNRSMRF
jgi:hypothetical protein